MAETKLDWGEKLLYGLMDDASEFTSKKRILTEADAWKIISGLNLLNLWDEFEIIKWVENRQEEKNDNTK